MFQFYFFSALANRLALRRRTQTLRLLSSIPSTVDNFASTCKNLCFKNCLEFNFC